MKKKVFLSLIIIIIIGLPIFCVLTILKGDGYPDFTNLNFEVEPLLQIDLSKLGIEDVSELAWSLDGDNLAIGTYRGLISLVDADTGEVIRQFQGDDYSISTLDWSPNGAFLASISADFNLRIWNPEKGEVVDFIPGSLEAEEYYFPSKPLVWSKDDQSIVYVNEIAEKLIIHNIELGENTLEMVFSDSVYALSWHEHGILIFTGEEIKLLDIDKQDFETVAYLGEVELSRRNKGRFIIYDAEFSPQGELALIDTLEVNIADVLYFLRFLDYRDGADAINYTYQGVSLLSWSDDGQYLAFGSWDGEIAVGSLEDMTYLHVLGTFPDRRDLESIAWSPDGEKVAAVGYDGTLVVYPVPWAQ